MTWSTVFPKTNILFYRITADSQAVERQIDKEFEAWKSSVEHKPLLEEEEDEMTEMMQRKYPREYSCSRKVADYIEKTADCKLSGEEVLYLTLHIRRVAMADSEDE